MQPNSTKIKRTLPETAVSPAHDKEDADLLCLSRAVAAHLKGQPAAALEILKSVTPDSQDFPEVLVARARLHVELAQYKEAFAQYERLLSLPRSRAEGSSQAGACLTAAISRASIETEPPVAWRWAVPIRLTAGLAALAAVVVFMRPIWGSYPPTPKLRAGARTVEHRPAVDKPQPLPPVDFARLDPQAASPDVYARVSAPTPAEVPTPAPANTASRRMHASMRAMEASWVTACSDGKKIFEGLVTPDQTRQIGFSERAVVRVGNAGGLAIALDGKPIGSLGRPGQVQTIELQPEGFRLLRINESAGACLAD